MTPAASPPGQPTPPPGPTNTMALAAFALSVLGTFVPLQRWAASCAAISLDARFANSRNPAIAGPWPV
ncbi:hypothetical protein [Salinicola acroporae]|uniref:hypothetical protein n=1 Tax=Salinicola acroporae TaxID=1541440 RepID=UPI002453F4B4|nr:hypothetical protein [Salinicola acroporae]